MDKKNSPNDPNELSGSDKSESDGTLRIDVNLAGNAGTNPSSSASEANSCFIYFAIIIITPPPLKLPHTKFTFPPRTSRCKNNE